MEPYFIAASYEGPLYVTGALYALAGILAGIYIFHDVFRKNHNNSNIRTKFDVKYVEGFPVVQNSPSDIRFLQYDSG